jgi:glycosyltransferase involved in cell wall biosynthesis
MTAADTHTDGPIETHLVVTPARNEAENLQRLGECLIAQTWRPAAWIVVDNGSTDGTPDLVRELGRVHGWIRLRSIEGETDGKRGRSSVRAFNTGVAGAWRGDLITSLDADVSFEPTYFDSLRREFERNPRLGIATGVCHELHGERWEPVHVTRPNLRGAALTFRKACLMQLLPLEGRFSWDGIATIRANIRGWETAMVPAVRYFHHRPTGARDASRFSGFAEDGDSAFYMWYRPSYIAVRTLYRAFSRRDPAVAGLAWGYVRSAVRREPRHREAGFREFVRSAQSFRNWQLRANEVRGKR